MADEEFHLDKLMKGINCGSDLYKAPEVLKLGSHYVYDDKAADVYSLGVFLVQMLYYFKPFGESCTQRNIGEFIRRQKNIINNIDDILKVSISENARELINLLLEPNPEQRINSVTASVHIWLK
jgi:serine/threonine protein kinase